MSTTPPTMRGLPARSVLGTYALYALALAAGMRRGELLGLRRRDRDPPSGRPHVRQQWTRDGKQGRLFKGLKKGSKQWPTIELDKVTVEVLREHLEAQEFEGRTWGSRKAYSRSRSGRLFGRAAVTGGGRRLPEEVTW